MGKKQRLKKIRREERTKLKVAGEKRKSWILVVSSIVIVVVLAGLYGYFAYRKKTGEFNGRVAAVETNKGVIKFRLLEEDAPVTSANFAKLAREEFYDNTKFHRVEKGTLIQGGDPNSKNTDASDDGQGGPGYTIPLEVELDDDKQPKNKNKKGAVGMAKIPGDINSNGSQFYILLSDQPQFDGGYTVFGKVIEGINVVKKIKKNDVIKKITIEGSVTLD